MRSIIGYIREYFYETDKRILVFVSFFTAILIYINYQYKLDENIREKSSFAVKLMAWYLVFLFAFALPWLLYILTRQREYLQHQKFIYLVLLAPAIFSLKICLDFSIHFSDNINWNNYWNHIIHWPSLLIITATILFVIWKMADRQQPFY